MVTLLSQNESEGLSNSYTGRYNLHDKDLITVSSCIVHSLRKQRRLIRQTNVGSCTNHRTCSRYLNLKDNNLN